MARVNDHYLKLKAGYLFPEIGRRVTAFTREHPEPARRLIRCGIGDVTEPLPQACRDAMHAAVDDLGARATFHGYGPEQGYPFLREAIAKGDYQDRGVAVSPEEIFVSDGSKCDTGNILEIFGPGNRIAITDPVYPVYVDTNVMAGNTGPANASGSFEGLVYMPCTPGNGFVPEIPAAAVDLIYLCYPNNPTGATATREQLKQWVDYALAHGAILLYDAAYEAYIHEPGLPRSIFEIEGARECAIEFRSFSKTAGFTGVRCAFTVIPQGLTARTASGAAQPLHPLWLRRQTTKFNGASYIVQRGAAAIYTDEGRGQVAAMIGHYLGNAKLLRDACQQKGWSVYGGVNAPYVWVQCPDGLPSWTFFDRMLHDLNVVITPGAGFGAAGEGYFRISAFNSRENVVEVCRRIREEWPSP